MAVDFLDASLSDLTTIKVGGGAERIIRVTTEDELTELVAEAKQLDRPLFVIGGGSNVVFSDSDFPGWVIVVATTGIQWSENTVRVSAGEDWETFVITALQHGYGDFAPLSGIPGTVGATPIQNIGAYGVEIADLIDTVSVIDRQSMTRHDMSVAECKFGYRTSVFKSEPERYVVLSVTYRLNRNSEIQVSYPQLAQVLGVEVGARVDAQTVRDSVLALRGTKSMVVDHTDADSNSTGSFFINPTVIRESVPEGCPSYPLKVSDPRSETHVKLSAAWLIENAGIEKGFSLNPENSRIRVSRNHSLAIANPDSGTATEVLELASHMRQRVYDKFGIELEAEPVLVNCRLDELAR